MAPVKRKKPTIIALIPARSGSKRLRDKNVRPLAGHPLMAYTISAALQSGIFSGVIVSTDSPRYAAVARHYKAEIPFMRPARYATDSSPDIEWVEYTLKRLKQSGRIFDCFSILRPTSPLRQPDTIRRAWRSFLSQKGVDSLRAVEKCRQHPGKMWIVRGKIMLPLLPLGSPSQPWHSSQFQTLPEIYIQNASLEIAWTRIVFEDRTIAGTLVMPFFTRGYEGFDVNDPEQWILLEHLIQEGQARLPRVAQLPFHS